MKLKTILSLFLLSIVLSSCSDDDPVYQWRTIWTSEYQDVDGNSIIKNIIVDVIQDQTNEHAKVAVAGPASTFGISATKENIVSDNLQVEGDQKARTIVYRVPASMRPDPNYTHAYYLVEMKYTHEKVK